MLIRVEERQGRGKPRHATVIAADMQPDPAAALGGETADRRGIMPLGRAEQRNGAGLLGERVGEVS
jgi:hypothetical protein